MDSIRQIVGAFAVAAILLTPDVSGSPQATVTPSRIVTLSNVTKPDATASASISSVLSEAGVKRPSSIVTSKASLLDTSIITSQHAAPTTQVGTYA